MSDYVLLPRSFSESPFAKGILSHLDVNAVGAVPVDSLEKLAVNLSRRVETTQSFRTFMSYGASALQGLSYVDDDLRKLHGFASAVVNLCMAAKSLIPVDDTKLGPEDTKMHIRTLNDFLGKVREGELPSLSREAMQKVLAAPRDTLNDVLDTLGEMTKQIGTPGWQQKIDQVMARDAEWLQQNANKLANYVTRGTPHSAELLQFQEMRIRDLLSNNTYPPSITKWLEERLQGTAHLRRDHVVESFRDNQTLGTLQETIEQQNGLQQFRAGLPMDSPGNPSVIQVPFEFKAPHLTGTDDFVRGYLSLQKSALDDFAAGQPLNLQNLAPQMYLDPNSANQLSSSVMPQLNSSVLKGASMFLAALNTNSDETVANMGEQTAKSVVGATPHGRVAVALYEIGKMLTAGENPEPVRAPMAAPFSQGMSRG